MEVRSLGLDDVRTLLGWAAQEGWNPGLEDAEPFLAADPTGFLGGFVGGEMVAGISAVRYGTDFGFIGLYICRPDMRGRGYGRQVWDAGMAHLDGRTIGLDGVPEQQANYARMGFRPVYETLRWSGPASLLATAPSPVPTVPVDIGALAALAAFDRKHFPALRESFLAPWTTAPRIGRMVLRDGRVSGYAVARRCLDGYKIGPVFAEDLQTAMALLAALSVTCADETVHLDVPKTSAGFSDFLSSAGMSKGFCTARMYRGTVPEIHQAGVFAVSTLELG